LGIVSVLHEKSFRYRGSSRAGFTVNLIGEDVRARFLEAIGPHVVGREEALGRLREQVVARAADRSSRDTVPIEVLDRIRRDCDRRGWSWPDLERNAGVMVARFRKKQLGAGLRRKTLAKVAAALDSVPLAHLANSDVFWDRIVSIKAVGVEDVYDLEVDGDHNFVADGLIVHNSHSAAYALVAYQCAWLKAHYPAELMAATLTSEMSDSTRVVTLIEECRRMGLVLLPPDVNRSEWRFTIEDRKIRFGLGAVRNVGQSAVESIVAARDAGGPFRDLFDLACRLDGRALNRRVLESLVGAGACDALGGERGALFAGAGRVLEQAAALQREKSSGQSSLFGGDSEGAIAVAAPSLPDVPAWSGRERSQKEKEVLGFYFSEHPLTAMRDRLEKVATHTIADALQLDDGAEARLAGLVSEIKPIVTKAGKRMAVVTLEDLTGRIECTLFPEAFESSRALVEPERIVTIAGRIEVRDDRGTKLLAAQVLPIEEAQRHYRPSLHLEIRSEHLSTKWLEEVDAILSAHPGEADVYLHIVMPDHSRKASRSKRYRVADEERVAQALRERFGFLRVAWGKGSA
jgi:DNA polymerase-3 subunit alpha